MTHTDRRSASPTWGRGRDLLLAAARELFNQHGYKTVTTRQIAERAGVSEQMVFRHFGSKAKLFEAAAVAPFVEHLDQYVANWEQRVPGVRDPIAETVDLYRGLYEVFSTNRTLLAALLSLDDGRRDNSFHTVASALAPALDRFADLLRTEREHRGFRNFDTRIVVRLVAGLVMGQTVFAELLYPISDAPAPATDEIIHQMAMLTILGAWPPADT